MDTKFKEAWEDDLYPTLMIIARKYLPLEAEDLVQETLEALLLRMQTKTKIGSIKAYSISTLKYKIYERWRRRGDPPLELKENLPDPDKNIEESIENKEMCRKIWQALEALSPECRELIKKHVMEGKTFTEMTADFPQPRATIHHHYKQCLAAFEKEFKKYWDE